MKMDLRFRSYVDLHKPEHVAAVRGLIERSLQSVGPSGEFRIQLAGDVAKDALAADGEATDFEAILISDNAVCGKS